ncbi:HNH endonuclease signature motif containing protein [Mycolicibacterium sp. YH-1]|uniref:HNH endonuclease signature motif containing protein n=1 Tax=Mycolicibacterium sp. YH-1 TaxID=2908837 RepID=UPI001F4C027C|nr:HNH endonuclease signature motif containing protein [Mycolicibacterium sp. YH-1]UNB54335.1 HNH endonuclease [Mycolicibacterium sp. YH-1]
MFDELVTEASTARGGGAVAAWARVEAAACARRLAAMVAILDARQSADDSATREQWYLDNWGAVCAEIGAAQQITPAAASSQLLVATSLRDRLPKVAALLATGALTYQLASAIVWRTALIKDADALRAVDTDLAAAIADWPPMSQHKTITTIDTFVERHDPHALRRTQNKARGRSVDITIDDAGGLGSLWATLFAHDAKALDQRLHALAGTVCAQDPRTRDQRRADALGALAVGADRLACLCGQPHCDPTTPVPNSTVIYVITHDDTLTDQTEATARQDTALDGAQPRLFDKPVRELTLTEALTDTDPGEPAATTPGVMIGGPVLAGPIIRRLALQAAIKRIIHPGDRPPEPRYTPSAALANFVRCRDLTCRFPGCDHPADHSDIDHTIPYPTGPTCASNLKCLCRKHHLLKTFYNGPAGWRDRQQPDGTIIWTAPHGQTYHTQPGSHLLFPSLCEPTAPVLARATTPGAGFTAANTGLTMPRRDTTRAQDRKRRIDEERRENQQAAQLAMADSIPPF